MLSKASRVPQSGQMGPLLSRAMAGRPAYVLPHLGQMCSVTTLPFNVLSSFAGVVCVVQELHIKTEALIALTARVEIDVLVYSCVKILLNF